MDEATNESTPATGHRPGTPGAPERGPEAGDSSGPAALSDADAGAGADDVELAERLRAGRERILTEVRKRIIGQEEVVEQVLLTLFVGGNSLLKGVPGLAKTLLVQTISEVLDLDFSRIQFTPDLMPSDITGTEIIQTDSTTGERSLVFARGPIFAHVVLADEINRTPPKTQAALLEAMQERRVTVQGVTYDLEAPFFVFATQNPIELEGTYPLPEAQLDRFMFEIRIDHLAEDEELEVVRSTTGDREEAPQPAVTGADLLAFQSLVRRVPVPESVLRYAVGLVRASRPKDPSCPESVKQWTAYGASVRAAQYLVLGAKARALIRGRFHANFDDIRALTGPVLRHRLIPNFQAQAEGVDASALIERLVEAVAEPKSGM